MPYSFQDFPISQVLSVIYDRIEAVAGGESATAEELSQLKEFVGYVANGALHKLVDFENSVGSAITGHGANGFITNFHDKVRHVNAMLSFANGVPSFAAQSLPEYAGTPFNFTVQLTSEGLLVRKDNGGVLTSYKILDTSDLVDSFESERKTSTLHSPTMRLINDLRLFVETIDKKGHLVGSFATKADLLAFGPPTSAAEYAFVSSDESKDGATWQYNALALGGASVTYEWIATIRMDGKIRDFTEEPITTDEISDQAVTKDKLAKAVADQLDEMEDQIENFHAMLGDPHDLITKLIADGYLQ